MDAPLTTIQEALREQKPGKVYIDEVNAPALVGETFGTYRVAALVRDPDSLYDRLDWVLYCTKCGRRRVLRATRLNEFKIRHERLVCSSKHRIGPIIRGRAKLKKLRVDKRLRARHRYFPEHYDKKGRQ